MKIDVLTLFPNMFEIFGMESIVGNAIKDDKLDLNLIDIRDFAFNKNRKVDDYPYGGGPGMIMKPEPISEALDFLNFEKGTTVIYFTPQGKLLNQKIINNLANKKRLVVICGHYKEIDQRIRDEYVTEEFSIGDYVLTGGEIPAMVLIDSVTRLQKGVINDLDSAMTDSHQTNLLGCPHYTRPKEFKGNSVPTVLMSGNHKKIDEWRLNKSKEITKKIRPEFLTKNEK